MTKPPVFSPLRRAVAVALTMLIVLLGLGVQADDSQDAVDNDLDTATFKKLSRAAYDKTKAAKTIDDYTQIADICVRILKSNPSSTQSKYAKELSAWALNRRGELYALKAVKNSAEGKPDEAAKNEAAALADFDTAVSNDPARWKAIHNRGVSYASADKFADAETDFSRVIQLNAEYANAWFNRGEVRYALGQYELAIADYKEALRLNSTDFGAYTSRGHAYFQRRRFREALDDYDQAVLLNPSSAKAVANRADAYASLGAWGQAAKDYRRAVDLDDRLSRAYQSAGWFLSTCPDQRYRDTELALTAARQAIELDGRDYRNLDTLAAAQASAGKFVEAKATLAEAIEKAPNDVILPLRERLELYEQEKPYRIGSAANDEPEGVNPRP